jgi:hypothetical protein
MKLKENSIAGGGGGFPAGSSSGAMHLNLFKLIRKNERYGSRRPKLPHTSVFEELKNINNPYIDRTVIFNQYTTSVIHAASANLFTTNSNMKRIIPSVFSQLFNNTNDTVQQLHQQQQQRRPITNSFNLSRNELSMINGTSRRDKSAMDFDANKNEAASDGEETVVVARKKLNIYVPTAMSRLPDIKESNHNNNNNYTSDNRPKLLNTSDLFDNKSRGVKFKFKRYRRRSSLLAYKVLSKRRLLTSLSLSLLTL